MYVRVNRCEAFDGWAVLKLGAVDDSAAALDGQLVGASRISVGHWFSHLRDSRLTDYYNERECDKRQLQYN